MKVDEFANELKLEGKILAIKRCNAPDSSMELKGGCTFGVLTRVFEGETVVITAENARCRGAITGFGLSDEVPNIPGGFGYFIAGGRGKGYPLGERIKRSPELAEKMLKAQPQNVCEGFDAVMVSPYKDGDDADMVTMLVNSDQLSALVHLYNFDRVNLDSVVVAMSSGCASVFRIPFGELGKENPRAVIGGVDVFSRPYFPADTLFFTLTAVEFEKMLEVSDLSIFQSHIWKGVKSRL